MKHTPGPWDIDLDNLISMEDAAQSEPWQAVGISDADGIAEIVAMVHPNNASLIAAAPEMYETIQRLMEQVTETGTVNLHEGIRAIALLARIDGTEC